MKATRPAGFRFPSNFADLNPRQTQILETAEARLGKFGVNGLELRAIADDLEVSPSLINHYYTNSEELIFDTVLFSYNKLVYGIQEKNQNQPDAEKILRSWIESMLNWLIEYPGIGVILEFPRQVLRTGGKKATSPEKILTHFTKEMSKIGIDNVSFMASAVYALQTAKPFKVLAGAKIATLIATSQRFAANTSLLGFATIGGGLWVAGRRPADSKTSLWMKLGFDPAKQMTKTVDEMIRIIKSSS